MFEAGTRVRSKTGSDRPRRQGTVLAPYVHVEQNWTPILWDDEADPTFYKSVFLELMPDPKDLTTAERMADMWLGEMERDTTRYGEFVDGANKILKAKN